MDGGGGLFATGDHGRLGRCLGASTPRARSMRLWDNTSANNAVNEVSMTGERRNDTNRTGPSPGTQFNDQSDDVPQQISPKMYTKWYGIFRQAWPHPLLCGPNGVIRVMPDHPHEGECIEPADPDQSYTFDGYTNREYPAGSGGSPRPLPEVISFSSVPAGNTADYGNGGSKDPTQPHTFGGICAYDGHRASIGRVVTDATWHHFVNVNLVGEIGEAFPKNMGFTASTAGLAHLEEIRAYYRNLAVWLSRSPQIRCMNRHISWSLIWRSRVIEAVASRLDLTVKQVDVRFLFDLGRHARDVLGRYAGRCQSLEIVLELLIPFVPINVLRHADPWRPFESDDAEQRTGTLPWFSPEPMLDVALGGALLALREKFPELDEGTAKQAEKAFDDVVADGVRTALEKARQSVDPSLERFSSFFR